MLTKLHIARKVADEGVYVYIANGMKTNILKDLVLGNPVVCTCFSPSEKQVSSIKKWIAHSDGFAKGEIYIDRGAEKALYGVNATSILFIGIWDIKGDFKKNDIVKIMNGVGHQIGVGRAEYDSDKAIPLIRTRDARPMIHYDYLYLD